jgi:hypothetical protein
MGLMWVFGAIRLQSFRAAIVHHRIPPWLAAESGDTFSGMRPILPALVLTLSACASAPAERPLSVRYVVENAEALDGREILVTGWVEECWRLGCALWDSRNEMKKDWPYYLPIGASRWFDRFAEDNAPTRVTLRARFHNRCIANPVTQVIGVCADRSDTLEVLRRR